MFSLKNRFVFLSFAAITLAISLLSLLSKDIEIVEVVVIDGSNFSFEHRSEKFITFFRFIFKLFFSVKGYLGTLCFLLLGVIYVYCCFELIEGVMEVSEKALIKALLPF